MACARSLARASALARALRSGGPDAAAYCAGTVADRRGETPAASTSGRPGRTPSQAPSAARCSSARGTPAPLRPGPKESYVPLLSGVPIGSSVEDLLDWLDDHGVVLGESRVYQHYTRSFQGGRLAVGPTGQWFVHPEREDQWAIVRGTLDGASFGGARVRVHMVRRWEFSAALFAKGAPHHVYGKGRHLEVCDVPPETRSEEVAALFSGYALDYREVYDQRTPLPGVAARAHRAHGLQHFQRSNFVQFRTREEAHRALRDHAFATLGTRAVRMRVVA